MNSTFTRTCAPGVDARSDPAAKVVNTAGMVRPVASPIMLTSPVRPGWPSFMITTPAAPAAWALSALTANPQVPRCIKAMLPAAHTGEVGCLAAAGVRVGRQGRIDDQADREQRTGRFTLRGARIERVAEEVGLVDEDPRVGRDPLQLGVLVEEVEHELLHGRVVTGRLEALDDVVHRAGIAGQAGRPVSAVGVSDRLQRLEMLDDTLQRHRLGQLAGGVVVRVSARRARHSRGRHDRQRDRATHHTGQRFPQGQLLMSNTTAPAGVTDVLPRATVTRRTRPCRQRNVRRRSRAGTPPCRSGAVSARRCRCAARTARRLTLGSCRHAATPPALSRRVSENDAEYRSRPRPIPPAPTALANRPTIAGFPSGPTRALPAN